MARAVYHYTVGWQKSTSPSAGTIQAFHSTFGLCPDSPDVIELAATRTAVGIHQISIHTAHIHWPSNRTPRLDRRDRTRMHAQLSASDSLMPAPRTPALLADAAVMALMPCVPPEHTGDTLCIWRGSALVGRASITR